MKLHVKKLGGGMLEGDLEVEAFKGREKVGSLVIQRAKSVTHVFGIWVDSTMRREGIGTKLYERAAVEACRRYGKPLGTDPDATLERAAEKFWLKQVRRGRATRKGIGEYVLRCPAPKSLSGR